MRRNQRSRGYSLAELLTIVAIIGIISMVAIPAFVQIMPQYRIRSAASEVATSLKMIRTKAVSTRSQWRMQVNPGADQYSLSRRLTPASAWVSIGENGNDLPPGVSPWKTPAANITGTVNFEIIFERDGTASTAGSIVLAVPSTLVKFNRYTILTDPSGNVTVVPSFV